MTDSSNAMKSKPTAYTEVYSIHGEEYGLLFVDAYLPVGSKVKQATLQGEA